MEGRREATIGRSTSIANQPVELKLVVTNTLIVGDIKAFGGVLSRRARRHGAARGRTHISEARQYLDHDQRRRRGTDPASVDESQILWPR